MDQNQANDQTRRDRIKALFREFEGQTKSPEAAASLVVALTVAELNETLRKVPTSLRDIETRIKNR